MCESYLKKPDLIIHFTFWAAHLILYACTFLITCVEQLQPSIMLEVLPKMYDTQMKSVYCMYC